MVKLIHTRFFLIWFNLIVAFIPSRCNAVLRQTAKFMRFYSPTSKPIFLSSLLRVNGDHQGARPWWLSFLGSDGSGSSLNNLLFQSHLLLLICPFENLSFPRFSVIADKTFISLPCLICNCVSCLVIVEVQPWRTVSFLLEKTLNSILSSTPDGKEKVRREKASSVNLTLLI